MDNYNYSIHYNIYLNICLFAEKWRKYEKKSDQLSLEEFKKKILYDHYIKMEYTNLTTKNDVIILFLPVDSIISTTTAEMGKMIHSINKKSDIIIISENNLSSHVNKSIKSSIHRIKTYVHENFSIVIPNASLCSKHELLSSDETKCILNNELYCSLHNLPRIKINDPQCIWIGAEIGDVVKITSNSDISGTYIHYRVVIPYSDNKITFRSTA